MAGRNTGETRGSTWQQVQQQDREKRRRKLGNEAYWFKGVRTPEKAKKRWHELCKKHHPDTGGDPAVMQQITAEYQSLVTAFAWKEEWQQDTPPRKSKPAKPKSTGRRKSTTQTNGLPVQASIPTSAPAEADNSMEQLIDAGVEFGRLILKSIVHRRKNRK